ncbi:MAG TPA: hypothetical protein VFS25_10045 [Chitinophaga sp.]|uniref:hypothetical protein n=1 Tax=Chitinophaga sp. TaxID=1869181 RepID=UPI002DBC50A2|nr:hypothetical protein [Chitinophaga sp.]HEU4553166.1 hypothetical protein [Chitinophaga sp.]
MRLFTCLVTIVIVIAAVSCRKGELPEEHYFGKVAVTLVNLPNTPDLDLYFDGKKLQSIAPSNTATEVVLPAGRSGRLEFFKANTDSLLIDSTITISANTAASFRVAYNEEIGLKGFINSASVSPDSVAMQMFETLSDAYYPYTTVDLHIIFVNNQTGNIDETGIVLKNLTKGKLYPDIVKLPVNDESGLPVTYGGRFVDSQTGNVITQPDGFTDLFQLPVTPGAFYLLNIHDDAAGNFFPEVIDL